MLCMVAHALDRPGDLARVEENVSSRKPAKGKKAAEDKVAKSAEGVVYKVRRGPLIDKSCHSPESPGLGYPYSHRG